MKVIQKNQNYKLFVQRKGKHLHMSHNRIFVNDPPWMIILMHTRHVRLFVSVPPWMNALMHLKRSFYFLVYHLGRLQTCVYLFSNLNPMKNRNPDVNLFQMNLFVPFTHRSLSIISFLSFGLKKFTSDSRKMGGITCASQLSFRTKLISTTFHFVSDSW